MTRVTSMRAHRAPAPPRGAAPTVQQQAQGVAPPPSTAKRIGIGVAITVLSAAIIAVGARVLGLGQSGKG